MFQTPLDIIERFVRYERSLQRETLQFRRHKHNADLCPTVQRQLERIIDAFSRFVPLVYDTQGPSDDGVDVLVRVGAQEQSGAPGQVIGFQIKSEGEMGARDLLPKLKAQRDDAFRKVLGLTHYYMMLCADEAAHKGTIRRIESEFRTAAQTTVIEPTYAHYFLNLSPRRIEGFVTRALSSEDIVFRRALETVQVATQSAAVLGVFLATHYLTRPATIPELQSSGELRSYYDIFLDAKQHAAELAAELGEVPEDQAADVPVDYADFESLFARDVELLDGVLLDVREDAVVCRAEDILPLTALLTDARVRYDLSASEAVPFALEALGLLET